MKRPCQSATSSRNVKGRFFDTVRKLSPSFEDPSRGLRLLVPSTEDRLVHATELTECWTEHYALREVK